MAGGRRPGPLGLDDDDPPPLAGIWGAGYVTPGPVGLGSPAAWLADRSARTGHAIDDLRREVERGELSFTVGAERYRLRLRGQPMAPDEEVLAPPQVAKLLGQASELRDRIASIPDLTRELVVVRVRPQTQGEAKATAAPEPPPPAPPPPRPRKKEPVEVEVEVQVVDADGKPRRGLKFKLETPDGEVMEGRLDGRGSVWTKSKEMGSCRIVLQPPDDPS
jgi:hypothetical protein